MRIKKCIRKGRGPSSPRPVKYITIHYRAVRLRTDVKRHELVEQLFSSHASQIAKLRVRLLAFRNRWKQHRIVQRHVHALHIRLRTVELQYVHIADCHIETVEETQHHAETRTPAHRVAYMGPTVLRTPERHRSLEADAIFPLTPALTGRNQFQSHATQRLLSV